MHCAIIPFSLPQAVASMAGQILKLVHVAPGAAPGLHHKRNSEIINSLLGISKLMNEAGRRWLLDHAATTTKIATAPSLTATAATVLNSTAKPTTASRGLPFHPDTAGSCWARLAYYMNKFGGCFSTFLFVQPFHPTSKIMCLFPAERTLCYITWNRSTRTMNILHRNPM